MKLKLLNLRKLLRKMDGVVGTEVRTRLYSAESPGFGPTLEPPLTAIHLPSRQ